MDILHFSSNTNPLLSNSTLDIEPLRTYFKTIAPAQAIYYTGDHFPSLNNTFLFGIYTGDIYSIHIDNHTNTIDLEKHIQIDNRPFQSVIDYNSKRKWRYLLWFLSYIQTGSSF